MLDPNCPYICSNADVKTEATYLNFSKNFQRRKNKKELISVMSHQLLVENKYFHEMLQFSMTGDHLQNDTLTNLHTYAHIFTNTDTYTPIHSQ